jgi:hypothetical protein
MQRFSQSSSLRLLSYGRTLRQSTNQESRPPLKSKNNNLAVIQNNLTSNLFSKRVDSLSRSLFAWPLAVLNADYRHIKVVNGMDAYFFVRFLRMMCRVFFPIWLISWAILLPSTSVKTKVPPHSGLDKFVFGNIEKGKTNRYGAHLILVWLFTSEFAIVFVYVYMHLTWPKFGFGTTFTWRWSISSKYANSISFLLDMRYPLKPGLSSSRAFLPSTAMKKN